MIGYPREYEIHSLLHRQVCKGNVFKKLLHDSLGLQLDLGDINKCHRSKLPQEHCYCVVAPTPAENRCGGEYDLPISIQVGYFQGIIAQEFWNGPSCTRICKDLVCWCWCPKSFKWDCRLEIWPYFTPESKSMTRQRDVEPKECHHFKTGLHSRTHQSKGCRPGRRELEWVILGVFLIKLSGRRRGSLWKESVGATSRLTRAWERKDDVSGDWKSWEGLLRTLEESPR